MKLRYLIVLIILAFPLGGCRDWIDISPSNQVDGEELFESRHGFVLALNGIYLEMESTSLYGRRLTTQALDVMAQYYYTSGNVYHYSLTQGNYEASYVKDYWETIWNRFYFMIANLNIIIEECDKQDGVLSDFWYSLIKGEALALRAFLHFDLLRLFGPIYSDDPRERVLPYRTISDIQQIVGFMSSEQVCSLARKDLTEAIDLLGRHDPILSNEIWNSETYASVEEIGQRQYRMNYYAAKMTLARVLMWTGDLTGAGGIATGLLREIDPESDVPEEDRMTDASKDRVWLKMGASYTTDYIYSSEIIFATYSTKREENVFNELFSVNQTDNNLFLTMTDGYRNNIMYDATNDLRRNQWAEANRNNEEGKTTYFQKFAPPAGLPNSMSNINTGRALPLMRLSEIYLMAAECSTDMGDKLYYLNRVRHYRGCIAATADSNEQFMDRLTDEFRREVIGEGQMFYFYKRLGIVSIPSANDYTQLLQPRFRAPLPDSETYYNE